MLAARKMKISGSRNRLAGGTEKVSEQEFKQQLSTYNTYSIKPAARGVSLCNYNGKELYQKSVLHVQSFFFCCYLDLLIFFGRSSCHHGLELYDLTVEPTLTATSSQRPLFMADNPCIDSCLKLSTTAIFFYPQGCRCGEAKP